MSFFIENNIFVFSDLENNLTDIFVLDFNDSIILLVYTIERELMEGTNVLCFDMAETGS